MRLGFWQKTAVFASVAGVGLSGLLWFILHDIAAGDFGDAAYLLLTLHGASSYALLVAVGSLLPLHVRTGWRRGRNMVTGIMVTVIMAVLSISALMLYYGGEETQGFAKWIHLVFGFGCFALFPAHALVRARQHPTDSHSVIGESMQRPTSEAG